MYISFFHTHTHMHTHLALSWQKETWSFSFLDIPVLFEELQLRDLRLWPGNFKSQISSEEHEWIVGRTGLMFSFWKLSSALDFLISSSTKYGITTSD
jgi:hypothetical protein